MQYDQDDAAPYRDDAPDEVDALAVYFREIGVPDLLTAEEERELARDLRGAESLTWECILADPAVARVVLAPAAAATPPSAGAPKPLSRGGPGCARLLRALGAPAKRGKASASKYASAVRAAAAEIRAQDIDRALVAKFLGAPSARAAHKRATELRAQFIEANLRLVVTVAKRHDMGGMPLADLIQEGNLGLMHAVPRFDPERGLRFSTFACWWIRHAIGRALADKARAVRVPVHFLDAQTKTERCERVLAGELGRPPTQGELEERAGASAVKIAAAHDRGYAVHHVVSLDTPLPCAWPGRDYGQEMTLGDVIGDDDVEDIETTQTRQARIAMLERALPHLTAQEQDVVRKRFGFDGEPLAFREIGEHHNLSRERIRQILKTALKKIREVLVVGGVDASELENADAE